MGEGAFPDLVFIEVGERLHIVPVILPLPGGDVKIPACHLLGLGKTPAGKRYLLCIEIAAHHPTIPSRYLKRR